MKDLAHTALLTQLQENCMLAGEALEKERPVAEVIQEHFSQLNDSPNSTIQTDSNDIDIDKPVPQVTIHSDINHRNKPRIIVIGAGLAGLTCAYRLKQAGYFAKIYEASERVGGRCWTIRNAFVDGQIAEHGGELIRLGPTGDPQFSPGIRFKAG